MVSCESVRGGRTTQSPKTGATQRALWTAEENATASQATASAVYAGSHSRQERADMVEAHSRQASRFGVPHSGKLGDHQNPS